MNVAVVVEGPSDGASYPVLMQKIRGDLEVSQLRECGGKSKLKNVFPSFLKEFQRNHAWQIDIAFVIRDSDCAASQEVEEQLRNVLDRSGFKPNLTVEFFAVKCDLETWLLADEHAINHVSSRRGKNKQVGAAKIRFEADRNAKEIFLEQLSKVDLRADPQVYREIANSVDIARIAALCPSFRRFITKIRAC